MSLWYCTQTVPIIKSPRITFLSRLQHSANLHFSALYQLVLKLWRHSSTTRLGGGRLLRMLLLLLCAKTRHDAKAASQLIDACDLFLGWNFLQKILFIFSQSQNSCWCTTLTDLLLSLKVNLELNKKFQTGCKHEGKNAFKKIQMLILTLPGIKYYS